MIKIYCDERISTSKSNVKTNCSAIIHLALPPPIMMSSSTTLGWCSRTSSSAARPSRAESVWYPSASRLNWSIQTTCGSSSTTRSATWSSCPSSWERYRQRSAGRNRPCDRFVRDRLVSPAGGRDDSRTTAV